MIPDYVAEVFNQISKAAEDCLDAFDQAAEALVLGVIETLEELQELWVDQLETTAQEDPPHRHSQTVVQNFRIGSISGRTIFFYDEMHRLMGIGDPSCIYNARSPEIRCAVHPQGPCEGCPHYERRPQEDGSSRF
jgi:hypothetical protein